MRNIIQIKFLWDVPIDEKECQLLSIVSKFRVNDLSLFCDYINTKLAKKILMDPLVKSSLKKIDIHNYDAKGCLDILSLLKKCKLIENISISNNVSKFDYSDEDKDNILKKAKGIKNKLGYFSSFDYTIWYLDS